MQNRNDAGAFTLMEVLIAMTFFACGVVGVLGAFSVSTRAGTSAMRQEQAARIAQRELAEAQALPAELLAGKQGKDGMFTWELSIEQRPMGLVLASTRVTWLDSGRDQKFELNELLLPRHQGG